MRTALRRSALLAIALTGTLATTGLAATGAGAAMPPSGAIKHIVVIDLENESAKVSFSKSSPAPYLAKTLTSEGAFLKNYYGIGHVSLDNYIAQVSGQAPNPTTQIDCITGYANVTPGTATGTLGQVKAKSGCVYPASVKTIADQLDAINSTTPGTYPVAWRAYEEDMGNDKTRDGGTTCAHPAIGKSVPLVATATDGYVPRHDPFVWFHSIIDNKPNCQANVVALGSSTSGALATDFGSESTTPAFSFVTPSVCNDGHDATCTSPSAAGGHVGGLKAANAWLKKWIPVIQASPAYQDGSMLVVVTFDEAEGDASACCGETSGPNVSKAGGYGPGGGRIGAVVLNKTYITPGTVSSVKYNHYSALRTYEDLLGITGTDGEGHLGMAGATGLATFGTDVFSAP